MAIIPSRLEFFAVKILKIQKIIYNFGTLLKKSIDSEITFLSECIH